jgi:hypothetical protein
MEQRPILDYGTPGRTINRSNLFLFAVATITILAILLLPLMVFLIATFWVTWSN